MSGHICQEQQDQRTKYFSFTNFFFETFLIKKIVAQKQVRYRCDNNIEKVWFNETGSCQQ
jgi:hypothetical protein